MATSKWQVQEAKADLSSLIRAAEASGPQTITRSGKAVAVVLSLGDFERLTHIKKARRGSLLEFFKTWPEFEIPVRDTDDVGRPIDL